MLIDKVKIKIKSGKGGNGVITWRREKFVAFGGPDGGDGGDGGSIYLEATHDMRTLLDFQYKSTYNAEPGEKGARKNCHGKNGEDLIIKVPCGTIVRDEEEGLTIADLTEEGQRALVASGGKGGKGNARFKNNKNTAPYICEPGEASIERELSLELKMIADVGIMGFPNAGKSTLISKASAAKPKIGDYAFTTVEPNLGVVRKPDGDSFVMADIPGLIEGASEGHGLGHDFLRHIERTKVLVHVVDVWGLEASNREFKDGDDPIQNYLRLNVELERFNPKLLDKPQILVLNKIEAYPEDELKTLIENFQTTLDKNPLPINTVGFFQIAAFTGEGVDELKDFLCEKVDEVESPESHVEIDMDYVAEDHDDSSYRVHQDKPDHWNIRCGKLERFMKIVDLRERESLSHLFRIVKSMGIFQDLKGRGAEPGHAMNIDGVDFDLDESCFVKDTGSKKSNAK